ncbi:MAG: hypothetical protein GWP10_06855 [Nitrospiraceae bacterium]|nr:hypothetical protein [Nitrospiraceae bacterium]
MVIIHHIFSCSLTQKRYTGCGSILHTLCTEAHHEQRGDLNGDGQITVVDAVIALRMAVSGEHNDDADMDGDGRVTSVDALMVLQAAVAVYTNLSSSKQCYYSYKLHRKRLNGFHKNNETCHDVYRRCKHISWL